MQYNYGGIRGSISSRNSTHERLQSDDTAKRVEDPGRERDQIVPAQAPSGCIRRNTGFGFGSMIRLDTRLLRHFRNDRASQFL